MEVKMANQVQPMRSKCMGRNKTSEENNNDLDAGCGNKMVLVSVNDEFSLCQDICCMCGSFGRGEEGSLICCYQCGSTYHPFCVNVSEISPVGWRCLDCVVCEGCGKAHDEGKLLLCDQCDISYHIYCLEPPLDHVPQGIWLCVKCGPRPPTENKPIHETSTPGLTSLTGTMSSSNEHQSDEFNKADSQKGGAKVARQALASSTNADNLTNNMSAERRINSKYRAQFMMDGVLLSEFGMNQIKSLFPEQPKKQRAKRGSKQNQNPSSFDDLEDASNKDEESVDNIEDGFRGGSEADIEKKKKLRRIQKAGIGGFNLKQRSRGLKRDEDPSFEMGDTDMLVQFQGESPGPSASSEKPKRRRKLKKKPSLQDTFPAYLQEAFFGKDLLETTPKQPSAALDDVLVSDEDVAAEKISQDKVINLTPSEMAAMKVAQQASDQQAQDSSSCIDDDDDDLEQDEALRDLLPLPGDLGQDDELMDMLMNEGDDLDKAGDDALDELPVDEKRDDPMDSFNLSPNFNLEQMVGESGLPQMDSKDVEDLFKGVLSPSSQSLSQEGDLISPASNSQVPSAPPPQQPLPHAGGVPPSQVQGMPMHPGKPMSPMGGKPRHFRLPASAVPSNMSPLVSVGSMLPHGSHPMPSMVSPKPNSQMSGPFQMPMAQQQPHQHPPPPPSQQQSAYHAEVPSSGPPSMIYSPQVSDAPPSPWPEMSESESIPASQKNLLKWEADEALGTQATISPVLYANVEFPNLKKEYPNWADRVKQISKLWRQLPSDRRQPYLQKARENRAQNRIQKTQQEQSKFMSKEPPRIPGTSGPTPGSSQTLIEGMEDQEVKWRQMQATRQQQQQHQQHSEGAMQMQSGMEQEMMSQVPLTPDSHHHPQTPQPHLSPAMSTNEEIMSPRGPHTPNQMGMANQQQQPSQHPNSIRPPPSPASTGMNMLQVSRVHPPIDSIRMSGPQPQLQQQQQQQQSHMVSKPPEMVHSPANSGMVSGPRFSQIRPPTPQRSPFSPASPAAFQAQSQPQPPQQQQGVQQSQSMQGPGQIPQHPNTPSSANDNVFHTPPATPRPQSVDSTQHPPPSPFLSHQQPRTPGSSATPFSPSHPPGSQSSDQYVSSPVPPRPHSGHMSPGHSMHPSTPHQSNDPYSSLPPTPRVPTSQGSDQFSSPSPHSDASRQRTGHLNQSPVPPDPYVRHPMTPRARPSYESQEAYSQPGTPRPPAPQDPYARPPSTPHPASQVDPYSYQPGTPSPGFSPQVRQRPPMPPPPPLQDPYARPVGTPMPASNQTMGQSNDPYDRPPRTPQVPVSMESTGPPHVSEGEMEGQPLTRPQLRDLLQKQQQRRQQVEQMRTEGPRMWNQGMNDPNQRMTTPNMPVMRTPIMRPPDGFRQPIPPGAGRPRIAVFEQQMFRHPISPDPRFSGPRMSDPRMRAMFIQQSQMRVGGPGPMPPQGQPQQWIRPMPHTSQPGQSGPLPQFQMHPNAQQMQLSPRGPIPQNQMAHMVPISNQSGAPMATNFAPRPQYAPGQPHMQQPMPPHSHAMQMPQNVVGGHMSQSTHPGFQQGIHQAPPPPMPQEQQGQQIPAPCQVDRPVAAAKHPSTTELVLEVQGATQVDILDDEEPPEDIDDDELLGLGNDFNILEYADPELNQAQSFAAGKNNIFDEHLDDLDPDKIKDRDDQKDDKKEPDSSDNKNDGPSSSSSGASVSTSDKQIFPQPARQPAQHHPAQTQIQMHMQRPQLSSGQQPPPPYPGQKPTSVPQNMPPPPPYSAGGMRPPMLQRGPRPSMPFSPVQSMPPNRPRAPGISEQPPLLLEDLVEQERREQQQQQFNVNPASIPSNSLQDSTDPLAQADTFLSDVDFERLKADILSDDSLSGQMQSPTGQSFHHNIPNVQGMPQSGPWMQDQEGQPPPMNIHARPPPPIHPGQRFPMMMQQQQQQQPMPGPPSMSPQGPMGGPMMGPGGPSPTGPNAFRLASLPKPPSPPAEITNEAEAQLKAQYDKWLVDQQVLLTSQQKQLENEVQKLRKSKKTLNARQRQLKKTGTDLNVDESNELQRVMQEQNALQKNLEQVRKLVRQHNNTMQEYRLKPQKRVNPQGINVASPGQMAPTTPRGVHSPMISMSSSGPGTPMSMQVQAGPSTPQSPAMIMSPSPMGGAMSPMMHSNSPASLQPIPSPVPSAGMPASPMMNANMQSPVQQVHLSGQQMSPMMPRPPPTPESAMSVHPMGPVQPGQVPHDDNNPFSDNYKEKLAMQQGHSPRGPHPQMGHPFPNQGPHGPQPPMSFPGQDNPNRPPMQYHTQPPRPGALFRYPSQQIPPNQRPYGELVGQSYQSQMPPQGYPHPAAQHQNMQPGYGPSPHPHPHQMPQQGPMMRRPPPPPYPGQNPHQQQQMQQMMPQQQSQRIYGSPQMTQYPQHMQQPQMPPQQYQQRNMRPDMTNMGQVPMNYYNAPGQSPSLQQQQMMKSEQIAMSTSTSISPRSMSVSSPSLSTPSSMTSSGSQASLTSMSHMSTDSGYSSQEPMVGEAKTFQFSIHEHGSGHENDAGNESILQRCSEQQQDHDEQPQQQPQQEPQVSQAQQSEEGSLVNQPPADTNPMPIEEATEQVVSHPTVSCSEIKQEPIEAEECQNTAHSSDKLPSTSSELQAQGEQSVEVTNPPINKEEVSCASGQSDSNGKDQPKSISSMSGEKVEASECPVMKQNVLLKQLLQNCPSADSKDEEEALVSGPVGPPKAPLDVRKELLIDASSALSTTPSANAPGPLSSSPPLTPTVVAEINAKAERVECKGPQSQGASQIAFRSMEESSINEDSEGRIKLEADIKIERVDAPSSGKSDDPSSLMLVKAEKDNAHELEGSSRDSIASGASKDASLGASIDKQSGPGQSQKQTAPKRASSPASGSAGGEKKLSYLDIRRQQLEREPTPPLEESKPKRRRIFKKKEKEPKEPKEVKVVEGPPSTSNSRSSTPPATGAQSPGSGGKKRSRKSSHKSEEDYERFMSNFMNTLRSLPPMMIKEPTLRENLNVVPVPGTGDLNSTEPKLRGTFCNAVPVNAFDYYSTVPFGKQKPPPIINCPPPPGSGYVSSNDSSSGNRGFYNQEFTRIPPPSMINCYTTADQEVDFYMRDTESPDSIVQSSPQSPDLFKVEFGSHHYDRFSSLKYLNDDTPDANNNEKCMSPVIELEIPIPNKSGAKRGVNQIGTGKENELSLLAKNQGKGNQTLLNGVSCGPLREAGNVAVTLTLSAANEVRGVLDALAKVLGISAINDLEIIERPETPQHEKLPPLIKEEPEMKMDIGSGVMENGIGGSGNRPPLIFCKFCEIIVLNAGIKKKASELPPAAQDELDGEEVTFCSSSCCMQFALSHRGSSSVEEKGAATIVSHSATKSSHGLDPDLNQTSDPPPPLIKLGFDLLPPMSPMMEEDDVSFTGMMSPKTLSPPPERLPAEEILSEAFLDEEKMSLSMSGEESSSYTAPIIEKKWKGVRYKSFKKSDIVEQVKQVEEAKEPEPVKTEQEIALENEKRKDKLVIFKPDPTPQDLRTCLLCHGVGDGKTNGASRLLNYDVARWIHLNCALWSSEVYETLSGSLMNVDLAVKKARTVTCVRCRRAGASLKCFKQRCSNVYHFPCAVKDQCMFYKDKTLLCPLHMKPNPEQELTSFVVFRKVYINKDEQKQVASMIHQAEQSLIRIGNLIFLNIGQLLPHQLQAFHTPNYIFPVGYKIARFYWSKRVLGHRCKYICSIEDVDGRPEFKIEIHEPGYDTEVIRGSSPKEVWQQIIDPIVKMRQEAGKIKVFTEYISGEDLFGLTEPTIVRILESLPGVDTLRDYNFRYGRSPLLELPLAINPTGCARTEPKLRTHFKRPHTMHTSNATRSSLSSFTGTEISSPYVKQFVHSKSSQYRKMKTEWRNNVYLARSRIQGLGLYAARDIEKHTMVIEYIGLIIRNEIAERNERIYEEQNRGIYMFRLDDDRVIDATLQGGLARYINHSCNPNCVAESVEVDRDRKILIIANRRINRGEELSYDYKFDVEDDQHKIPCLCGAPNCRKWMN